MAAFVGLCVAVLIVAGFRVWGDVVLWVAWLFCGVVFVVGVVPLVVHDWRRGAIGRKR